MVYIDTEPVLRYLFNEGKTENDETARLIENGDVSITTEVLTEVVNALQYSYGVPRTNTANALLQLLGEISHPEMPIVLEAILTYEDTELDFADCLLCARSRRTGAVLHTFNEKLKKQR